MGARITGDLLLDSAHFSGRFDNGLKARSLTAHALHWTNVSTSDQTELDLSNANVVIFEDNRQSWPAPGHLFIDGFVYGTLEGDANDAEDRLDWLRRQPLPLRPQPYKQLAKMFLDNGEDSDATAVLVSKDEDMRRQAEVPEAVWQGHLLRSYLFRVAFKLTLGFGYQPLRALWWAAAFVAIGTCTFRRGYRMGLVIPTDHEAYRAFKDPPHNPPAGYQPFNSFVYSLENFVPLVQLHQAGYWLPCPRKSLQHRTKRSGRMLRWYLWLHILIGWIFTSTFVAGLSGLISNQVLNSLK